MNLLELREVTKEYPTSSRRKGWFGQKTQVQAVNRVNVTIQKAQTWGLVGESGSGKSTLAKLILKIEPLTAGEIFLKGQCLYGKKMKDLFIYKTIQLVLQDSSSSLHPKLSIREILMDPIRNFFPKQKGEWEDRLLKCLQLVELDPTFLSRYPHQLSGGQKQRVAIARALAVGPEFIIFDESLASLDEESQHSILSSLKSIREEEQLTYLFITHDLQSAMQLCDQIAIMYQGELVETFSCSEDVRTLQHPYSQLLFQGLG
ncbi:ABC transporter ATP-binding protein [Ammoniphilus sp. YIM 78166]|uniref:ABC transporter ATP-binding protein n=1 Tax=Ammoniphilus sp. YIM 78166 TaxID=1644106 RepID=UPI0010700269|nr:dipeptide/oligopeptide/nickel ABC transporter ATP-binding protein [Ammoniphilus sp. YIM 78166]